MKLEFKAHIGSRGEFGLKAFPAADSEVLISGCRRQSLLGKADHTQMERPDRLKGLAVAPYPAKAYGRNRNPRHALLERRQGISPLVGHGGLPQNDHGQKLQGIVPPREGKKDSGGGEKKKKKKTKKKKFFFVVC